MSMESFYGGRQGVSFVIVKRFDREDIPDGTAYRVKYYAVNQNKIILYPFIERTNQNYNDYNWTAVPLDGGSVTVVLSDGTITTKPLNEPVTYQEGMRQCFEKGGDSVDVVNYGEYVIIDTVSKDNPENGRVYRRGMNYDYDPNTNPLAGAEYIGQIVGPKGDASEIDITTYQEVIAIPSHQARWYEINTEDPNDASLVPGVDVNRTTYNDEIYYAWATLRDTAGSIDHCQVGFKFPYLVPEISAYWRSPYYTQEDYDQGRIHDRDLIDTPIKDEDNFSLFVDNGCGTADRIAEHGDTGHPFYRKWKLNVPRAMKGDSFSDLKLFPTIVTAGSKAYTAVGADGETLIGTEITLAEDYPIVVDSYWDTFSKGYVTIKIGGQKYYSYLTNTAELHYGYLWTWYDDHKNGDHKWIDIGKYNVIDHLYLDDEGWIHVFYTCDDPQTLETAIRWIWYNLDENAKGIEMTADGTITVWYNTKSDGVNRDVQQYDNILKWITETALTRNGHFKLTYNNNDYYDPANIYTYDPTQPANWKSGWSTNANKASWETDLTWPTQVSLSSEGVLKFLFNNNLLQDIYPTNPTSGTVDRLEGSYSFIIPWLNQVKLLEDGHFNFKFNNDKLYDSTDSGWDANDHTLYKPLITWITKATLSDTGVFKIYFNNDLNKSAVEAAGGTWDLLDHAYVTQVYWIKDVDLAANGTLTLTRNDNTIITKQDKILWIKSVALTNTGELTITRNDDTVVQHEFFRWIEDIEFNDDGTFRVKLNNGNYDHQHTYKWVTDVETKPNGDYKVTLNTGEVLHSGTHEWVSDVKLEPDGTYEVKLNTGDTLHSDTYKWVTNFKLDEDGTYLVKLNTGETLYSDTYKWVTDVETKPNGEYKVTLNTGEILHSGTHEWVTDVSLNQNGQYVVTLNTGDTLRNEILKWVDNVEIAQNGAYVVKLNTGETLHSDTFAWVSDASMDATGHFTVTLNTGDILHEDDFQWVETVDLSQKGVFKAFYNNGTESEPKQLYWINNLTIDKDTGILTVTRNDDVETETQLDWVKNIVLANNGQFTVEMISGDSTTDQIYWIKDVSIAEDGTVTFIYCDDTVENPHRIDSAYKIKYVKDVYIDTKVNGGEIEGSQKLNFVWNTVDGSGDNEETEIGEPINYIVESIISIPTLDYPNVPYWHLLIYYSDPALRYQLRDKWVSYPSGKEPGVTRNQWVDMGSVKGENSGIHILKNVTNMNELKDAGGNWIPPEELEDANGVINANAAGWSCTLQEPGTTETIYLFYDYDSEIWYRGVSVAPSDIDPSYVIVKSEPNAYQEPQLGDASNLQPGGFWFALEKGIAVR